MDVLTDPLYGILIAFALIVGGVALVMMAENKWGYLLALVGGYWLWLVGGQAGWL